MTTAKRNNLPAIPETIVNDAERLARTATADLRPVVGWFQWSPRRGGYGIRFHRPGTGVVDLGTDGTFTPVRWF